MSKTLCILMLLCWFSLAAGSTEGRAKTVRVTLEVDGREVHQKFKITLYAGDEIIEPRMFGNGFIVPPEIKKHEKVGVRVTSEDNDLFFDSIFVSKFDTDWVVGVDRKPFAVENMISSGSYRKTKLIFYINFISKEGDGTGVVVQVRD